MGSKYFYMKVFGNYGLFTAPESKGGGEKMTYMIPTRQALKGIVDACYFKPTFVNVVDEVKVMNKISTSTMGIRALYSDGSPGLNYFTALEKPMYLVKFHFEWNNSREDLAKDRNIKKHEAIMQRSIKKGGRRDVFLGTREFVGYIEEISEEEYELAKSYYFGNTLSFGYMFQEFIYPKEQGEPLLSCYSDITMKDGIITYIDAKECPIKNELSDYNFKYPDEIKSVDEEYEEVFD